MIADPNLANYPAPDVTNSVEDDGASSEIIPATLRKFPSPSLPPTDLVGQFFEGMLSSLIHV